MKSEGFKRYVNSLVKGVLALLVYAFEVAKGMWIGFMDWLSGTIPDWVKKLGGCLGGRYAGAGTSVEESTKGLQEKTERLRLLRRIESGEGMRSRYPVGMLHDPVTPPPAAAGASYIMDVGGVTVQAADTSDGKQVGQDVSAELDRRLPVLMGLRSEDLRNAVEDTDSGRSE